MVQVQLQQYFYMLQSSLGAVRVKYRGKIKDTILNILGGLRSSCTYVGAPSLKQLSKCTTFVRVTKQFNDTFVK